MLALAKKILQPAISGYYIRKIVHPGQQVLPVDGIGKMDVLQPPERVHIASPDRDAFVPIGKYYRDGYFNRLSLFVCEIPNAHLQVTSGLVCTAGFNVVADEGLDDRLCNYRAIGRIRPFSVKKLRGAYSSVYSCFAGNFGHWMFDCLPKVHSLAKVAPRTGLTLLMPDTANEFQRETLRCVVPDHFKIEYISGHEWLKTELFLWPSIVSGRCMYLLPTDYNDAIRGPIFAKYGLPTQHVKKERLYVSRGDAKHRRILNEDAVMHLLEKYGFRKILLEKMTFRQQIELFHSAEVVIGPHGAGICTTFFSGDIDVVVFYPVPNPQNYFHSQAIGLGQRHHFICHNAEWEDHDYNVNLDALEKIVKNDLHLKPSA